MIKFKSGIENAFGNLGRLMYDNKYKTLLVVLIIIAAFFSQLPKITIDTSSEGFLHENDPTLLQYNQFREQFGRDEVIVLAIKTPEVFSQNFLSTLDKLHRELEDNLPYLDEVNSLINARNTHGVGDSLIVDELFEELPTNDQEMAAKKALVLNNKLFKNLLISEDAKFTTIQIRTSAYTSQSDDDEDLMAGFDEESPTSSDNVERQFLTDAQNSELVAKIQTVIKKYQNDDFVIYAAGSPIVIDRIKRAMQHDMQTFTKLSLLGIGLILFLLFRRVSGVVMPLIVVILTLLSTFATMAATGTALKLPTQILPSFLLAVGVASSVHVLAMFFRYFDQHENKREAIAHAMSHSGLAIVMASLTTAAGLLSFSTSSVAPIADLGVFAAAGVLISLIYTLILLPAMIAIIPLKHKKDDGTVSRTKMMDKLLLKIAHFSTGNHKLIIGTAVLAFLISIGGLLNLTFFHDPLKWLPESWDTRKATELVDVKMKGSGFLEVIVDTGEVNGLYDPGLLAALDKLNSKIKDISTETVFVGKTISVLDILKESNRALHANDENFYTIPSDRELIAQELLLFENSGSDDLEDFVDSQFSMARITIKTPWSDAASNTEFIELIQNEINSSLDPSISTYVTGMGALFGRTMNAAIESTKISYVIATVIITLMMIALLGSIKLGLISMIPNLLPILFSMGIMGYFSMPLDMFTMLIGSIAIGLVVDDTIHFMHNFQRYYHKFGDIDKAVEETLLSTGRAITVTTVVLCFGFFIFMAASMNNVYRFGLITGTTIIFALLADLFLAPALMKLVYGNKKSLKPISQGA